jgi:DNA-binding transcriptional regulator GbsR (MarR family)
MSSPAIITVIKMMESLSEDVQDRVAEHLREYLEDLQDELKWDNSFKKTQQKLIASAQRAKREIAEGLAKPMDYDQL